MSIPEPEIATRAVLELVPPAQSIPEPREYCYLICGLRIHATARGAGVPGSGGGAGPGGSAEGERDRDRATFECNICLDTARDAVISLCGHLFWYINR